jgi:hypothetical protein
MSTTSTRKRRGTADPRWGWSGVAQIISAQLSTADIERLWAALPDHRSPIEEIRLELGYLGGKYHRYLHQDEFGPSRAERMAGLRELATQFHLLLSQLTGLSKSIRLWLCKQLAQSTTPDVVLNMDIGFEAYSNDEEAVHKLAEAASAHVSPSDEALSGPELEVLRGLADAAEKAAMLLRGIDTTSAADIAGDFGMARLEVVWDEESSFAILRARIERHLQRIELALARLERRRGPEAAISLRWLVRRLCDLYHWATGQPVTSSAVVDYSYKSAPQSPAGRFVMACAGALRPPDAWMVEPDHLVAKRRARLLHKGTLERMVHLAMREYVADHAPAGRRRGRPKRVQ